MVLRKAIKSMKNMNLSFHTLATMSKTLKQLQQDGNLINKKTLERFSPIEQDT